MAINKVLAHPDELIVTSLGINHIHLFLVSEPFKLTG